MPAAHPPIALPACDPGAVASRLQVLDPRPYARLGTLFANPTTSDPPRFAQRKTYTHCNFARERNGRDFRRSLQHERIPGNASSAGSISPVLNDCWPE